MNNYYIDSNAQSNGVGTLESPFNTLGVLGEHPFLHPCNIFIKRNSVFEGAWDFRSKGNLINTDVNTKSKIDVYGIGELPKLIQADAGKPCLQLKLRNFKVCNILSIPHKDNVEVFSLMVVGSPDPTTHNAEVETHGLRFYNPYSESRPKALGMWADINLTIPTHRMRAYSTECINYLKGIQFLGNPGAGEEDPMFNLTDKLKMYGARCYDLSCVNMPGDALIYSYCASKDTSKPRDDLDTSYGTRIHHYAGNYSLLTKQDGTLRYCVPVWMVYSNNILCEWLEVHGCGPQRYDQQAFDFDIQSRGCCIRYFFSRNNAGGLLLSISDAQNVPDQGSLTDKEMYIDRGWGSQDNVIEYGLSFNDGVKKDELWESWSNKLRIFKKVANLTVRNVTFIDTVSYTINPRPASQSTNTTIAHFFPDYRSTDNIGFPVLTIDSCLFYSKTATGWDVAVNVGQDLCDVKKSGFYSEALGEDSGVKIAEGTYGTATDILYKNPLFSFIPSSAPCDIESASLIKFIATSDYYTKGSKNSSVADIMGNYGSAIGWIQKFK